MNSARWKNSVGIAAACGLVAGWTAAAVASGPGAVAGDLERRSMDLPATPYPSQEVSLWGPIEPWALARAEEAERALTGEMPRFAVPFETGMTPARWGVVEELAGDRIRWRLVIESADALSVNVGTRFDLPASAEMRMLDGEGDERLRLSEADEQWHGELWLPVVGGRSLALEAELDEADWEAFAAGFEVIAVNLGFKPLGEAARAATERREDDRSDACHVDVACPQADPWRDEVASVAWYTIQGFGVCSGGMLNNTAEDEAPYFMTAFHCAGGISQGQRNTVVTFWNDENSTCRPPGSPSSGGNDDGAFATDSLLGGATLVGEVQLGDFVLWELNVRPPDSYRVSYAGWESSPAAPSSVVAIHHPALDSKRISIDDDPPFTSTLSGVPGLPPTVICWRMFWEEGGLEGGSSGSPLFDQNGRVVGTGTARSSGVICPNAQGFYGKFDEFWTGSAAGRAALDPVGGNTNADLRKFWMTAFSLQLPIAGAVNVSTGPTLQWQSSENAVSYTVEVSEDASFASPVFSASVPGTTVTLPSGTLAEGVEHFWRVSAVNAAGRARASSTGARSFTTVAPPQCPGDVTADGGTDVSDFFILASNFGTPSGATRSQGDVTGDGAVDVSDFFVVASDFGCPN